jgi:transcriptional regulator with XRE-family HTH domain
MLGILMVNPAREVQQMIAKALEMSGDLASLAEESGLSYDTLYAWRTGRTVPRRHNLQRLADALRTRGITLQLLADDLEREAGDKGD